MKIDWVTNEEFYLFVHKSLYTFINMINNE